MIGSLMAINKIVDQGAQIQRSRSQNSVLLDDYNVLVKKFNELRDTCVTLSESFNVLDRENTRRAKNEKFLYGEIAELKETITSQEDLLGEYRQLREEFNEEIKFVQARYMTFIRVLEKVPDGMLLDAIAKTFADHPAADLKKEFNTTTEWSEKVEEDFSENIIGRLTDPKSYQSLKKK